MRYQDINAYIFDRWAEEGWQSSRPLNHQNYQKRLLHIVQLDRGVGAGGSGSRNRHGQEQHSG